MGIRCALWSNTCSKFADETITGLEIPTGNPLLIDLDDKALLPTAARYLDTERARDLPELP